MDAADGDEMIEVARFFGRLLLFELDDGARTALLDAPLAEALLAIGFDVSAVHDASLDALAAEYLETFLRPRNGGPLVQSLWTKGTYEGDAAVAMRRLAGACGCELDRLVARGAPADHLGCVLQLWALARTVDRRVSERIEWEHLAWAIPPLRRIACGPGFYAGFSGALAGFLQELVLPLGVSA